MKVHYILEEGLAIPCETGEGLDTVASLQTAVKYLNGLTCLAREIQVYLPGIDASNYTQFEPMESDDKLPNSNDAMFVHAPQAVVPDRILTTTVIPLPPKQPAARRASLPTMVESTKTDLPDHLKRKCFVKYGNQTIQVLMDPDEPLIHLKLQLEQATGVLTMEQRFSYCGIDKPFDDHQSLRFYGCQGGGFFQLTREEIVNEHQPRRATFVAQALPSQLQRRNSLVTAAEAKRLAEEATRALQEEQEAREAAERDEKRLAAKAAQKEQVERLAAQAAAEEAERMAKEAERLAAAAEALAAEREAEVERKEEEEAKKKAEEKWATRVLERQRKAEEEAVIEADEKAARAKAAAAVAARQKAEEEARLAAEKKAEEEAKKRAQEEWAARVLEQQKKAEEEARKAAEEASRQQAEEKARLAREARKRAEEEARLAEQTRKRAEEEARRLEEGKQAEYERIAREAQERVKAERLAAEEEAKREKEEKAARALEKQKDAEYKRVAKEAQERAKAERLAAEEQAKREKEEKARVAAEQAAEKKAEEQAAKLADQKAARGKAAAEEAARKIAQEEAYAQRKADAAKKRAEEDAKKKAEEEWAARVLQEQKKAETERLAKEKAEVDAIWARNKAREEVGGPDYYGALAGPGNLRMPKHVNAPNEGMPGDGDGSESNWNREKGPDMDRADYGTTINGPGIMSLPPKPQLYDEPKGDQTLDGPGVQGLPAKTEVPAKKERRRSSKTTKMKNQKSDEKKNDNGSKQKQVKYVYVPTPFDVSRQKVWYVLEGDYVPYYIRFNGWEKADDLKSHILKTRRGGRNAQLLDDVQDISELKLYAPGVDEKANPSHTIPSDAVLPGDTLETNPLLVVVHEGKGFGRELTPLTGRREETSQKWPDHTPLPEEERYHYR